MFADWLPRVDIDHILAALTYPNQLVCRVQLETGLRIGDVLALKYNKIIGDTRFTIKEQKTGKSRRVRISEELRMDLLRQSGRVYIFESRTNQFKHRTRQAVYKDLKRAAAAFRVKENIATHTMRKSFATDYYARVGDLHKVKELLNHSSEAVTIIYAMADVLTCRQNGHKL